MVAGLHLYVQTAALLGPAIQPKHALLIVETVELINEQLINAYHSESNQPFVDPDHRVLKPKTMGLEELGEMVFRDCDICHRNGSSKVSRALCEGVGAEYWAANSA